MNIIIMGYGRVGEQVANMMVAEGHAVTVIDNDPSKVSRLEWGKKIRTVRGHWF